MAKVRKINAHVRAGIAYLSGRGGRIRLSNSVAGVKAKRDEKSALSTIWGVGAGFCSELAEKAGVRKKCRFFGGKKGIKNDKVTQ